MAKTQKDKKSKPAHGCSVCRYFMAKTKTIGQCRAEPPTVTNASGKAIWPTVRSIDWCGCFKRVKS